MEEIAYHTNYKYEDSYWWFLGRNEIVTNVIEKICTLPKNAQAIDVGCGTGSLTKLLSEKFDVTGIDMSDIALDYCRKRGLTKLHNCLLSNFPDNIDNLKAIFMFEVIEHIKDDKAVVAEAFRMLKPEGYLITSVPAFQWLWSNHDVVHQHYRRYTKKSFNKLLNDAGFETVYSSYFNTFLFPLALLSRLLNKTKTPDKNAPPIDEVPNFVNTIFKFIFSLEKYFLPGIKFPYGLSIITIAKKK